jgi:type IV secretion system protein VirB11
MTHYSPGSAGLLKPIESWLADPEVSEILLNQPQEIWVEKQGRLVSHVVPEFTESHLSRLFQLIANENQQRFSIEFPLLSGSLSDGSRVQLCLPPTSKHYAFAIRRKVVRNFSLSDYNKGHFYGSVKRVQLHKSSETLREEEGELIDAYEAGKWDAFIRAAILKKKNLIVSGGTSSGKTTFLNACLREIPAQERLVILEDTRELEVPHQNQVQLLASKGLQGEAKVTMQDLVQASLRLRPDRILMGEIRGAEILDFVSACSTGHEGSMTSIHASDPEMAFRRMVQMVKLNNVPSMSDQDILEMLKSVVDIVIQLVKTPEGRRVSGVYYRYAREVH